MYDPASEVFYFYTEELVAGVEEPSSNPSLITAPINRLEKGSEILTVGMRYSQNTATKYASSEDNEVSSFFGAPIISEDVFFEIPPLSTFEFPAIFEPLWTIERKNPDNYANAKLTIPSNWNGEIHIPLVVHSIKGSGKVIIENKEYEIGTKELLNRIGDRSAFIHDFKLNVGQEPVSIVYLMNSKLARLMSNNEIHMEGRHLDSISAEVFLLPDKNHLSSETDTDLISMVNDFSRHLNRLEKATLIQSINVADKTEYYSKVSRFIESDSSLSQQEKTEKISFFKAKFESVFDNKKLDDTSRHLIFASLEDNSIFVLFFVLAEYKSIEELNILLTNYWHKKRNG